MGARQLCASDTQTVWEADEKRQPVSTAKPKQRSNNYPSCSVELFEQLEKQP